MESGRKASRRSGYQRGGNEMNTVSVTSCFTRHLALNPNSDPFSIKSRIKIKSERQVGGFTLVEMLVYMSVLMVLIGVGFSALYRCMDTSRALSRNTGDITDALHAGEDWRGDVRAAVGGVQVQSNEGEQILRIPKQGSAVSYRFAESTIFRRIGDNEWSLMLPNVKASEFVS